MSNTYLAIFVGSQNSPRMTAWNALSDGERRAREQKGIAAWQAWATKHQGAIVEIGGPLGKTKKIDDGGVSDIRNALGAFTVVRAETHEAAAKMFEGHPHFTMFPGEAVEVMPVLAIPGG